MLDLFENESSGGQEILGAQAFVLRGFALPVANELLANVALIEKISPIRYLVTPGGFTMSVGMTNCGRLGWTSDRRGYKYTAVDPLTDNPWPQMPNEFLKLARSAANEAGFRSFIPEACLINRYATGTRLSQHQDKDEQDLDAPIVSLELGISALFQFGGFERNGKKENVIEVSFRRSIWAFVDHSGFIVIHSLDWSRRRSQIMSKVLNQ